MRCSVCFIMLFKPNGMATRSRSFSPCGNSEVMFDMLTLCKPSEYNLLILF
jgi:hypothetical protein